VHNSKDHLANTGQGKKSTVSNLFEGPYVTYDLLPFPNGLKYQAHGPLIVDELVVNLTFELVGPGEYRVVHPKNMQPNIAMSEYT